MTLVEQAHEAGIGVEQKPCDQCGGVMLYPDPIDLKKRREKYSASRNAFARAVHKPDGKIGCAPSFIVMVETVPEEGRHRRCPEWLLKEYIRLPEMGLVPDGRDLSSFAAAGERNAKRKKGTSGGRVAKGQIWRKDGDPPVQVEVLQVIPRGTAPETAVVKRLDPDTLPPYTMTTRALKKAFVDVSEERS